MRKEAEVVVTGDRYLDSLVKFVEANTGALLLEEERSESGSGSKGRGASSPLRLKLNPVGLHYVQARLDALRELERLLERAPVDYLRAYVSDLGDHRALEQLRRILRLLPALKVISLRPHPLRDPTPLSLVSFGRLRVLELRGCDLSTSEARGLLQLTHCLEKLICHNSTDALRHVFTGRLVDIKDSPVWKHLSFVSCACNNLVLMDESLQLLPVVETLDLSRNRFSKVDNLKRCSKLRYLDLGFNHLRTVASLREALCPIVKLILRNNALTNLHGIENLKVLEGLDISYNVISTFSELELLSSLPSLKNLWLEGNPICCARWFRPHLFSLFPQSEKLELDGKGLGTREYWEMQAILARRQKKPTGYGFYFPAKDAGEEGGSNKRKIKQLRRLVSIDEEQELLGTDFFDPESVPFGIDHLKMDERAISDSEVNIIDLMSKIEALKNEQSEFWLHEFKEWLNKAPDDSAGLICHNKLDPNGTRCPFPGECSRDVSTEVLEIQNLGEDLVSEITPEDLSTIAYGNKFLDSRGKGVYPSSSAGNDTTFSRSRNKNVNSRKVETRDSLNEILKSPPLNPLNSPIANVKKTNMEDMKPESFSDPVFVTEVACESMSTPHSLKLPPYYKDDILQICRNIEEGFSQLSTDSCSVASSESDTSYSGDDSCRITKFISGIDLSDEDSMTPSMDSDSSLSDANHCDAGKKDDSGPLENVVSLSNTCFKGASFSTELSRSYDTKLQSPDNKVISGDSYLGNDQVLINDIKKKNKQKTKRRLISLSLEEPIVNNGLHSKEAN